MITTKRSDGTRYYTWGQDRNDERARAHIYEGDGGEMNPVGPLCYHGWNRSDGHRFSILRNVATGPQCKTCEKRAAQQLGYVEPVEHRTRCI